MGFQQFKEESLTNLVKRSNSISPTTKQFSTIRWDLVGQSPKGSEAPRLISYKIDKNTITFFFLSGATTPAYDPDYQFKATNPATLSLERNPSKTYEIHLQFSGLNKLSSLSKARASKKKFNPDKEKEYGGGIANITKEELFNFLKDSQIKIWDSSPAFQFQGQNFWLGQLDSSLFPTDIAPKDRIYDANGKLVQMGWSNIHRGSIWTKHCFDIMSHLSWYLQQMSAMLSKAIKEKKPEGEGYMPPNPPPPEKTPITPVQTDTGIVPAPSSEVSPEAPKTAPQETFTLPQKTPDTPEVTQAKQQITPQAQQQPQVDIKQRTQAQPLQNINQPTPNPNDSYIGNDNENPATYDPNKPEIKEKVMWKKNPFGYYFTVKENNVEYTIKMITEVEHFKNNLLELNSHEDFLYESSNKWNTNERIYLNETLTRYNEVNIVIDSTTPMNLTSRILEEVLDFVHECRYDIISFDSSLQHVNHSLLTKILSETIQLAFPEYNLLTLHSNYDTKFSTALIRETVGRLTEAGEEQGMPDADLGNNEGTEPETQGEQESLLDGPPEAIEKPKRQGKRVVCAVGNFDLITSYHMRLYTKIAELVKDKDMEALIILLDDASAHDVNSNNQRKQVIEGITHIKTIVEDSIIDFNSALVWLYEKGYSDVVVLSGNDEINDRMSIVSANNSMETNQGHYDFNDCRIVSLGDDNPDNSDETREAIDAIMKNDLKGYLKVVDLPYIAAMKKIFYITRYEIQRNIGLN